MALSTDGRSVILRNKFVLDLEIDHIQQLPDKIGQVSAAWLDQERILAGTKNGVLFLLKRPDLSITRYWRVSNQPITAIATHDHQFFVGDQQGAISWFADGETIAQWNAHDNAISCLQFAADEPFLVSGCQGGSIKIWPTQLIMNQLRNLELLEE